MNCHIIGYDLIGERDYDSLYKAIRSYRTYARILESQWVIVTSQSAVEVRNYLLRYMDDNDRLFVGKLAKDAAWHNLVPEEEGNKWLCKYLSRKY